MAGNSEKIAALSSSKRALLLQRLEKRNSGRPKAGVQILTIKPVSREIDLPLSYAQQRMWFLDQLGDGNPFYNINIAVELKGQLNILALSKSLEFVIERHEALRTIFPSINGRTIQVIQESQLSSLPVIDLEQMPEDLRKARVHEIIFDESRRPFELALGPLLRTRLLRLNHERYVLMLVIHHIVSDGWSMGVLVRDVAALYESIITGAAPMLNSLQVQYADYTVWQREWLQGDVMQSQLSYWKQQLDEMPSLTFPTDYPRPQVVSFRGKRFQVKVPVEVSEALSSLSKREGVTLFMTLLSAFQLLLARYSGQHDIVVGTPIAGRNQIETSEMIGLFVNTLLTRTDLTEASTFLELLSRIREMAISAYANQDLPFDKLVEELHPERSLSHNPLFQVAFALQNAPMPPIELPGLMLTQLAIDNETSKFDFSLDLWETSQGLEGFWTFSTDLFKLETIQQIAKHFQSLLEAIVDCPSGRLDELSMLTESEQHQMLSELNSLEDSSLIWGSVVQRFVAQVQQTPNATALIFKKESLTYKELNERANQLAHYLCRLSVSPGNFVGICVERSLELIIGIFGILKAGSAYVPMDPEYPRERLSFMLEDSQAYIIVTQQSLVDSLHLSWPRMVRVDSELELIAKESVENPHSLITLQSLAYLIYTSGTTGQPKAVMVDHGNLASILYAAQHEFCFGPLDVMPLLASTSFDISLFELLGPLLNGGTTIILSRMDVLDFKLLAEQLERATLFHMVPSLMSQFIAYLRGKRGGGNYSAIRRIFTGGDAVPPQLLVSISEIFPWAEISVLYGPTEATIICTHYEIECERMTDKQMIGGAFNNSRILICDSDGRMLPTGMAGEIYIGGTGVTRGYWQRNDLTNDKYVDVGGQRWYRSGDKGRFLSDGNIEFLGRVDHQVKVRGYRIELGEIEAVINQQVGIQESVVLASGKDEAGEKRLIAYVVPGSDYSPAISESTANPHDEQISQWEMVFDETYSQSSPSTDPCFNTIGWNSSYTESAIDPDEMREWLDQTVTQILSLRPAKVLEIGCGTGLILFQIAPHCSYYCGTDFSLQAINYVKQKLKTPNLSKLPVTLLDRTANNFDGIEPGSFDLIILNSVVQYFPSIEYLIKVLELAIIRLIPGGSIFIGDVRSFPLLRSFHASVELSKADDSLPIRQWRRMVHEQIREEDELVIDPAFFHIIRTRFLQISDVEILPKRGNYRNELTRFRYQVIIHIGESQVGENHEAHKEKWLSLNWQKERLSIETIRQLLIENTSDEVIQIGRIPNARMSNEVKLAELFLEDKESVTVGDLRARINMLEPEGVDPQQLWSLGEELGYNASMSWARLDKNGCFDATFRRPDVNSSISKIERLQDGQDQIKPWRYYANDPLQGKKLRKISSDLLQILRDKLPEYMVPSAIIMLDKLPLTSNGKVDRRELQELAPLISNTGKASTPPRSPLEEILATIFGRVLGVNAVSRHDNFFDLGGHSLLATQLISHIRETLKIEISLRSLFELPTISEIAPYIETLLRDRRALEVPSIRSINHQTERHLSFAQQRLWFIDQLEPDSPLYNIPLAVSLKGEVDLQALERTFETILRRHDILRASFPNIAGQAVLVIAPPQSFSILVNDLGGFDEIERKVRTRDLIEEELVQTFDLTQGPLLRVRLLRLSEVEHVMLLTMHHIISDGWSISVLASEVSECYQAYIDDREASLVELSIQYSDYVSWQREWLNGEVLEGYLAYWKKQLSGLELLVLPTDRPRTQSSTYSGANENFALTAELTSALKVLSRREGVTLFTSMLTVFDCLLSYLAGRADIIIGTPIACRSRVEIEKLIGFFVNMLPLRVNVRSEMSFLDLLADVREVTLAAYAHQDLPFDKLVEVLQPERKLNRNPLFQVAFALQNTPVSPFKLSGLETSILKPEIRVAKFELEFELWDEGDKICGSLIYSTDIFNSTSIRFILEQYQSLLFKVVDEPNLLISQLHKTLAEMDQRQHQTKQQAFNEVRRKILKERISTPMKN